MQLEFHDLPEAQRWEIQFWQVRLREAALTYAMLAPTQRDPTDLYVMAHEFCVALTEAKLEHYWRASGFNVTTCEETKE